MKNKGLKILLCVLLVLCIIMAGALIGKEYIGDNIKEASNRNGVDVVRDTSDAGKAEDNAVDSTAEGTESIQSDATKAEATEADKQQPQMSTIVITATGDCTLGNNQEQSYDGSFNSYYDSKGQDYFFGGVRDIFEADDMTLINLECVLSDATERVEKRWNLKGKPSYIGIMTGSSIEACSLGNNHTYDYGQAGLDDTRNVLDNAGILLGEIDITKIRHIMFRTELYNRFTVSQIMTPVEAKLLLNDSMGNVMMFFVLVFTSYLPVVDINNQLIGFISRTRVFSMYRKMVSDLSDE